MLKRLFLLFSKNSFKKYFLIVLGTLSWSLTMVKSGLCWNTGCSGGLGFWGANGHDGIWHIALINRLSELDFQAPVFSGWGIQNYHIGFDLIVSLIVRITNIPTSVLYFQIIPPVLAALIGLLVYKFVYLWRKSETASFWAVFFVYFGGSLGWLVSLIKKEGLGGESMFWSQQSISTLINPPFALSLVAMLLGLIFLCKYLKNKSVTNFILTGFFFGITIFIKVYAGLLVLTSLLVLSLWQAVRNKNFSIFWITLMSLVISGLLFIPFNKSSAGLISFYPFWFLESMMALSDRVGWQKLNSAMTTYKMGHIWFKAVLAYGLTFVIFIAGNFGTRIIAAKSLLANLRKLLSAKSIEIFLFVLIMAGIIVPTFFVQKGTPWNTIQFFYYSLIFTGITSGIVLAEFIEKSRLKVTIIRIMVTIIVLLTIPTSIASLQNYLPLNPQSTLPEYEVAALEFLSKEPDGVILTYPFDSVKSAQAKAPRPLYLYTSTAYVSAFSKKLVFLEDEMNLDIMQYPWIERREGVEEFLNTLDIEKGKKYLRDNNIKYVYWLKGQHARIGDKQLEMTKIYENDNVTIFKVNE